MGKRMYWILRIIQESKENAISAKDIILKLQEYNIHVDIKSIYSSIQRINDFFNNWLGEDMIVSVKKTGFMVNKEFFSDGELQFLFDSISFHEDLRNKDKDDLKQKLLLLSSFHQKQRLVNFIPKEKDISFSLLLNLSTIMKAIEKHQVIAFQYITYEVFNQHLKEMPSLNGNDKDQYIISPYQIILTNNHYYLISYNDKYKNSLTTYRIDRMRMIKTIEEQYIEIREQFDMSDEIEKMTNMYTSKIRTTLEIECHQRLLREVVSHFGKEVIAKKQYQETYLVVIEDVSLSEGLIGWIMMLQDQIKVVAPLSLQQDIKNRLTKISALYEDVI